MAVLLISWCVLGAGAIALGLAQLAALRADRALADPLDRIAIAAWLGLGAAASLSLAVGLFAPVAPWTVVAPGLAALASASVRRKLATACRLSRFQAACCPAVLVALAFHAAAAGVDAYDTALYHQQAVSWLSHFGVVKGLAWLHFRLGWSSSWFALGAALNHGFLEGRVSPILGGFVTALGVLHWLLTLDRIALRKARPADWYLLFTYPILLAAAWSWHYDISLGPDLPAWILCALAVWVVLLLPPVEAGFGALSLPFLLASLACSFKFSMLPLLPLTLPLPFLLARNGAPARWVRIAALAACSLPVLAAMAANVKTSGCPLYPSVAGRVQTRWAVPASFAQRVSEETTEFARWHGAEERHGRSRAGWLVSWVRRKDKAGLLGLALAGALLLIRRWIAGRSRFLLWVLATGSAELAFLFWGAPNPRFGLSFFLLFPATAFALAAGRRQPGVLKLRPAVLSLVAVSICAGVLGAGVRTMNNRWLLPQAMPSWEGLSVHVFNRASDRWAQLRVSSAVNGDLRFLMPVGSDQCWDLPLPCTPEIVDRRFQLRDRGAGLRAGFAGR
ncbi:MAG: hypothetical protein ABSH46_11920 [Bryobacteraceae bacterium]|jgi:hypothetical protein